MKFASEKKHESLSKIARNDWHGEHSPYFDGWKAYDHNPFHPTQNLDGVIQMGLAENQLSSPSRRNLTGEREMEVDWSSLHVLANASELVSEGLLSLSPAAQTRPNELPRIFWDKMLEMRGRDAKLVLEKSLRATDMDPNQGRLSIPKRQIRADFLSSEESQTLDNREAITVSLIEPCLEVRHGLQLKKWNYQGGAFSYVLTKQWNAVVRRSERNGLKENSRVQLWSFRVDGDLCFCLVNLEPPSAAAAEHMATHK